MRLKSHIARQLFCLPSVALCKLAARTFAMAASDDAPMLVETPVNPAVDPEWDLHFAVNLLQLLRIRDIASLLRLLCLRSDPTWQAPYAQLVLGSAAHALQVHAHPLTTLFLLLARTARNNQI